MDQEMDLCKLIFGAISLFQWTYGIVLIIVWGEQLGTLDVLPSCSPRVNKWYIWMKFYLCNPIFTHITRY